MKKTKKEESRGITLVALVITIIVMLIIAGVAVSAITANGIPFGKMQEGTEKYNTAAKEEGAALGELLETLEEYSTTKYVDWSLFTEKSSFLKTIDGEGNLYISEREVELSESSYTNTGIKLKKVNTGFKANKFIFDDYYGIEYILDSNGKIYKYNEETESCELLFDGMEFTTQYETDGKGTYIINKLGDIYLLEESNMSKLDFADKKFDKIMYGSALSKDGELYNLNYQYKESGEYTVVEFTNYHFIDVNGDLYYSNKKINSDTMKFKEFYFYDEYVVDTQGYLYEVSGSNIKPLECGDGILNINDIETISESYVALILKNGSAYDTYNEKLISIDGIEIKDASYTYILDKDNNIYVHDKFEILSKLDVKAKYIVQDYYGKKFIGLDSKIYGIEYTEDYDATLLSGEEKIVDFMVPGNIHGWFGLITINTKGEICYSLEYEQPV